MGFSLPFLRKRVSAEESTGAQSRINSGAFGSGRVTLPYIAGGAGPYLYHEGDLFTPGAGNFVPEAQQELPIVPIWGHGMMTLNPQQFNPIHGDGIWVYAPATTPAGLGGLQTGGIQFQPLDVGASSIADYSENFVPQL